MSSPLRRRLRSALAGLVISLACVAHARGAAEAEPIRDRNGDGALVVGCIGDSNTAAGWPTADTVRWCELAAKQLEQIGAGCPWPRLVWRNVALGGATVTRPRETWPWGPWFVDGARDQGAELLLASFGTNDLQRQHRRPAQVAAGYAKLARYARPLPMLVALTPPFVDARGGISPGVAETNRLLRARFAGDRLLDFVSGFDRGDLEPDGIHLTAAAQRRRAAIAVEVLRGLFAAAFGPCRQP